MLSPIGVLIGLRKFRFEWCALPRPTELRARERQPCSVLAVCESDLVRSGEYSPPHLNATLRERVAIPKTPIWSATHKPNGQEFVHFLENGAPRPYTIPINLIHQTIRLGVKPPNLQSKQ
jgi:hypothetical protein